MGRAEVCLREIDPKRDAVHIKCREQRTDQEADLLQGFSGMLRTKVWSDSRNESGKPVMCKICRLYCFN